MTWDYGGARPCVWCIVGFQWPGGCRSVETLVNEEIADGLVALGFTVMRDPWAVVEVVRWEEEHQWDRPKRWLKR